MTIRTTQFFLTAGLLIIMILSGCGEEEEKVESVIPLPFTPPALTGFEDTNWSPRQGENDPVVAKVGDASIHLSELRRHAELYKDELSAEQILEKLIELELLAQDAYEKGHQNDANVLMVVKTGAIREMLHHTFVEDHGEGDIQEADYQMAYNAFARKFDHFNAFIAGDAQFTCCYSADIEVCKKDEDVQACLEAAGAVVEWTQEQLLSFAPFKTIEDFEFAVNTIAQTLSADTRLFFHRLKFWYKFGQPYEEQTGFDKLNATLVNEIVRMLPENHGSFEKDPLGFHRLSPGLLGNPVRSNHGWHIPVLFGFLPERHDELNDPGVREEIAKGIYPQIQRRDYQCFDAFLYPQDTPDVKKALENCAKLETKDALLPSYQVLTSVNYEALQLLQKKLHSSQ